MRMRNDTLTLPRLSNSRDSIMADVQGTDANAEPSMEEILASIRRIIADEKEVAPAEEGTGEDALELTQMVQEDGSVVDVSELPKEEELLPPARAPEPDPEPVLAAPDPVPPPKPEIKKVEEGLVSDSTAGAASSSLASLMSKVQAERDASGSPETRTPLGHEDRTLEDMVLELMRPMLKAWLDENLPATVERLVQKELDRIARKISE